MRIFQYFLSFLHGKYIDQLLLELSRMIVVLDVTSDLFWEDISARGYARSLVHRHFLKKFLLHGIDYTEDDALTYYNRFSIASIALAVVLCVLMFVFSPYIWLSFVFLVVVVFVVVRELTAATIAMHGLSAYVRIKEDEEYTIFEYFHSVDMDTTGNQLRGGIYDVYSEMLHDPTSCVFRFFHFLITTNPTANVVVSCISKGKKKTLVKKTMLASDIHGAIYKAIPDFVDWQAVDTILICSGFLSSVVTAKKKTYLFDIEFGDLDQLPSERQKQHEEDAE